MQKIIEKLHKKRDENYKKFIKKIIPTLDEKNIIGVRMKDIRKIYTQLNEKEIYEFIKEKHIFLEEKILHSVHISKEKNIEKTLIEIEKFLPQIDNWGVCDSLRPKTFKKNHEKVKPYIEKWLESDHTYTVRFAIEMLMVNFLETNFEKEIFEKALYKKTGEYYIEMMQAWCIATMLCKKRNEAIEILKNKKLSKSVYKKAIQKARESNKIEKEFKEYLKCFT